MTAIEEKATEAWGLMFSHAMPARIALDFVQDVCGERGEACSAILAAATCHMANSRPSIRHRAEETGGSFPDFEAGQIVAAIRRGDADFAGRLLANVKARLYRQELNPTTEVAHVAEWIEWCGGAGRAINLCALLAAESSPTAPQKVYRGDRGPIGIRTASSVTNVTVDGRPLDPKPSQQIRNHSPDGFNWGYNGSGPSQLALAILFDVTGDRDLALANYQDFKRQFVAGWEDQWEISEPQIREWLSLSQTKAEEQA